MGVIYFYDYRIPKCINKSISYLSLAADAGHVGAQFLLGKIFLGNEYISCNWNLSLKYLSMAAKQSFSDAQTYLGMIFYYGISKIERNIPKSIEYFMQSSKKKKQ